jgi:sugar phosphate isomerase/epimerase
MTITRRRFLSSVTGASCGLLATRVSGEWDTFISDFSLNYILGSCMYGYMDLKVILPEVEKIGARAIDIWPKVHGNQREQIEEMGEEKFTELLKKFNVKLGCITQYKLGPFNLIDELRKGQRFGCKTIVTGSVGPKGLTGNELKLAVKQFLEKMKPQIEVAEETGITIAIENHSNSLVMSADSLKWLLEYRPSKYIGVALAPYHLPQDEKFLSDLIRSLGDGIEMFYAWQYGMGCTKKLPKEQEIMQMPGRGSLDFKPLLAALHEINYCGWTEIFMHPTPRGVPIRDTVSTVTEEINLARQYLTKCLTELP